MREEIDALVDGELAWWHAWQVHRHIHGCEPCTTLYRNTVRVRDELRAWHRDVQAPPTLKGRVEAALRARDEGDVGAVGRGDAEASEAGDSPAPPVHAPRVRLRNRRTIIVGGAVAGGAAAILLATREAPAHPLEKTLAAMARVRTAHAVGTLMEYLRRDPDPRRMPMELWYRQPDRFRLAISPANRRTNVIPGTLILSGSQGVHLRDEGALIRPTSRDEVYHPMSAFGFFSPEGVVSLAAREAGAHVEMDRGTYDGRSVPVATLTLDRPDFRRRWVLTIDPERNLILKSDYLTDVLLDGVWKPRIGIVFERFDYNLPLDDRLFDLKQPLLSNPGSSQPREQ